MTLPLSALGSAFKSFYLGTPGTLKKLRVVDHGYSSAMSRAEVLHQLAGGGNTVTRRRDPRRTWPLSFTGMTPDSADLLVQFYTGIYGAGPFCFVDPAWRNALALDASTFGVRFQALSAWSLSVTSQSLTYDGTVTPFQAGSGVARWTGAQSGSKMGLGTYTAGTLIPDVLSAPPGVTDGSAVTHSLSAYSRAISGTANLTFFAYGMNAAGSLVSASSVNATVGTTWTQFTATVLANVGATYVIHGFTCNTNSSPPLLFSNADTQYLPTAATPRGAWVTGTGSPRVILGPAGGSSGAGLASQSTLVVLRDHGIQLVEI